MHRNTMLDDFVSASPYTDPVDLKKLRFIFSAMESFASSRNKVLREMRVLEVACGSGGITLALASLGCTVRAFDIDANAVGRLRSQVDEGRIENVTVTVDNGYTFDDGNVYDVVIASEVFEHVPDPSRLAANITRRMTRGSYLIMTTPNGYGPWELKNRIDPRRRLREWKSLRRMLGKPLHAKAEGADHCQFYTKRRLAKLLKSFSLGLVRSGKSDSFLTMFQPLRRSRTLGTLDVKLADLLPDWLASGWYFVFELQ